MNGARDRNPPGTELAYANRIHKQTAPTLRRGRARSVLSFLEFANDFLPQRNTNCSTVMAVSLVDFLTKEEHTENNEHIKHGAKNHYHPTPRTIKCQVIFT